MSGTFSSQGDAVCILGFDIFVQEVIYKIIHPIASWVGRIPFLITTADFEEGFTMSRLWDFGPSRLSQSHKDTGGYYQVSKLLQARNESEKVDWSAYLRISAATPIEKTDVVVNVLEALSASLSSIGAEVRLLLFIDDTVGENRL